MYRPTTNSDFFGISGPVRARIERMQRNNVSIVTTGRVFRLSQPGRPGEILATHAGLPFVSGDDFRTPRK